MGWRVAAGVELAFDHLPRVQSHHDHVPGLHVAVINAGRFDHHQALVAVDAADVAPGLNDPPFVHQVEVGPTDLCFELFEHASKAPPREVQGTTYVRFSLWMIFMSN